MHESIYVHVAPRVNVDIVCQNTVAIDYFEFCLITYVYSICIIVTTACIVEYTLQEATNVTV